MERNTVPSANEYRLIMGGGWPLAMSVAVVFRMRDEILQLRGALRGVIACDEKAPAAEIARKALEPFV